MSIDTAERLRQLASKIEERQAIIGVIGLGYVGLPVAATFAQAGFNVIGVDIQSDRVAVINSGNSPIKGEEPGLAQLISDVVATGRLRATTDYAELAQTHIVTINVETPIGRDRVPNYEALRAACRALGEVLRRDALVIVESTVAPGTTERIVRPLLEEYSGKSANDEFFYGVCPERVMPGRLLANLRSMSRVCGGGTPETANAMVALYRTVVHGDLDMADTVTAELVKTTENAYRDVQIAFANEVALICEVVGADVWRVRELVNMVPERQMHLPGAGVGGHCIPKDSWLLASAAEDKVPLRLIPQARAVNDSMPGHVAQLTLRALAENGIEASRANVLVMGYAYIEDSDDTRNSPSQILVDCLEDRVGNVVIHDPYVEPYKVELLAAATKCDVAVVMVAHLEYRELSAERLATAMRTPILIDGRQVFDRALAAEAFQAVRVVGWSE